MYFRFVFFPFSIFRCASISCSPAAQWLTKSVSDRSNQPDNTVYKPSNYWSLPLTVYWLPYYCLDDISRYRFFGGHFQYGHPCVPKISKLVVSYRIRFMAFQSFYFFPIFIFFGGNFQHGCQCVPKIRKLVVSYRICFRWFWAFNFFPLLDG